MNQGATCECVNVSGSATTEKRLQKHQFGVGYSPKTINHLGVLHRLFEKAIEYEYIERNPVTVPVQLS